MSSHLPTRMWINQPSTLQALHSRHGQLGLAVEEDDGYYRFYPVAGDTISLRAPASALSPGWPNHLRIDKQPAMLRLYEATWGAKHAE
jgi:hypothetical protein